MSKKDSSKKKVDVERRPYMPSPTKDDESIKKARESLKKRVIKKPDHAD